MKRLMQNSIVAAVLITAGFSLPATARQENIPAPTEKQQKRTEAEAVAALKELGVPVQTDVRGNARWIEATQGELSDAAMRHLPSLRNLEWLEIGGGGVTASGAANLGGCVSLKRLYIHDVNLGGDQLAWLSRLKNLEALSLQRTGIDGEVLDNLKTNNTLLVLNISGNKIVDDDLSRIASLRELEVLALADTAITGTGLARLAGMPRLNELNISNCNINDADLDHFITMPNLRIVYAAGCSISDIAIHGVTSRYSMLAIFR